MVKVIVIVASVAVGQRVDISCDALPHERFVGEITSISVEGTATNGVTTYNFDVDLLNLGRAGDFVKAANIHDDSIVKINVVEVNGLIDLVKDTDYTVSYSNNKNVGKAVVTVTGKDKVGIIAMASAECAKYGANIIDISQTVMSEYFAMIMMVSLEGLRVNFSEFADAMAKAGGENGVDIRVMHEDIFNTMHRI